MRNQFSYKKHNVQSLLNFFQSSLNLPKAIIECGILVKLWEGGNQGEEYLRYVKPRIRDVHSDN